MDAFDLRLWAGFSAAGGDPSTPAVIDQVAIDSRRIASAHSLFIALEGTVVDGHQFIDHAVRAGARFVIAKTGWDGAALPPSVTLLTVASPLRALQQIAGAYRRQLDCLFVGIAGSYGKTMVKDLLLSMAASTYAAAASPESFNSQIGVPLSVFTVKKHHTIAFIEAGVSQVGEMEFLNEIIAPDCGIVTHIGKKHIATLKDLPTVASEMAKLFKLAPKQKKGWVLVPEDPHLTVHSRQLPEERYFWSKQSPSLPHASFSAAGAGAKMPYRLDFPGGKAYAGEISSGYAYFLDLINICTKAAWLLGVPADAICAALQHYTPEPMRTEIWKSPAGATFINDIYCSDPQSVDNALTYMLQAPPQGRKVFIFGGMRSSQPPSPIDYRRIGQAIHRAHIDLLVLYGKHDFKPLVDEVKALSPSIDIVTAGDYESSLEIMKARIKPDDTILIKGANKHSLDSITAAFNDSISNNQCIINLAAIASNLAVIRTKLAAGTRIMVMVKALAYGTDEVRMAKFLHTCGIDILGVSYVDEGVALKRSGVTQDIFVINAAYYEAAKVVKWGLEIGVSDLPMIEAVALEAKRQGKRIKVHVHVDTGMSRFGCRPEDALSLAKAACSYPELELEGLMTHLACADDPAADEFTHAQAQTLTQVAEELRRHGIHPHWVHAANSSASLRFDFPQFNMVRLGLAVYGLCSSTATKQALELRMALSLISRIVGINVCKRGETISYGRHYSVQREEERIAVLPIGYFDGLHRNYSGKSAVVIRGQKAPMVGKICMDFMMVDVTDIPHATPGDSVLVFGEDEYGNYLSPEDLATSGESIVHELITCLGPRIQRVFVYEEARHAH